MTQALQRNLAVAALTAGLAIGLGQGAVAQTTPAPTTPAPTPPPAASPSVPAPAGTGPADPAAKALDEATQAVRDAEAAAKASIAEAQAAVDAASRSVQDAATPPDDPEADPSNAGVPDDDDDAPAATATGPTAAPTATPATQHHDYGPSGIMTRSNREDLAPLTLASGKPVAAAPYALQSGGFYRIDITADGSAELALSGGDFFRAIWINEVVINGIEIRPTGVHSIEFDEAGTAQVSFVAIQPGTFTLSIPGSTGETQKATFTIR